MTPKSECARARERERDNWTTGSVWHVHCTSKAGLHTRARVYTARGQERAVNCVHREPRSTKARKGEKERQKERERREREREREREEHVIPVAA